MRRLFVKRLRQWS